MIKRILSVYSFLFILLGALPIITSIVGIKNPHTKPGSYISIITQALDTTSAYAGGYNPLNPPPPPPPPITPCGSCGCGNNCTNGGAGCSGSNGPGGIIQVETGYETINATDLTIKGQMPIILNRWYSSGSSYDSPLGYGWSFAYNVRLYLTAENMAIIREGCGAKYFFVFTGGTWQAPANYNVQLYDNSGIFTLQDPDGSQLIFDTYGRLSESIDPNGNSLHFQYDPAGLFPISGVSPYGLGSTPTITSYDFRLTEIDQYNASGNATGRWIKYSYDDSTGRMTGITDSYGRSIVFTHDQYGNLTGVAVYDASGNLIGDPSIYNYSSPANHLVTSYSGGESPVDKGSYYDTYDSSRRVSEQVHGTSVLQFQYAIPTFTTTTTWEIIDYGDIAPNRDNLIAGGYIGIDLWLPILSIVSAIGRSLSNF